MTTYKDSGVDIEAGDQASKNAYTHAESTFASRQGRIGQPVSDDGGFAGLLDMGEFYLVQNDDGTGSKMELAIALQKFDGLGYDLVAMVADDAICMGAEVVSLSNTLDVPGVDGAVVDSLLSSLAKACTEQQIVIPGGEIAEVPGAVSSPVWNATSVGIVAKDHVITTGAIAPGDTIISLRSAVARSNGFSLIRKVLSDNLGDTWYEHEWRGQVSWGEILLTPSIVYHSAVLTLLGRYGEDRAVNVKGLAHITGGGIAGNLSRTLKKSGCGAVLNSLWAPHDAITDIIEMGSTEEREAYRTWNMGNGMLLVVDPADADNALALLEKTEVEAKVCGEVTASGTVELTSFSGTVI